MRNISRTICKIFVIAIASIIILALLIILGFNAAKFLIYPDYYEIKTDLCKNPGLSDGFVCQGLCAFEESNLLFISGYMKDHSASRIYVTDLDNNHYSVSLKSNGEDFKGHSGGIAVNGETVYLASDNKLFTFNVKTLINSEDGNVIDIGEGTEINNESSFVFIDGEYIYVGEFHDGVNYITNHHYETPDGDYYAIMSRYAIDDLSKPDRVYSIRNKVQGMCRTDDGRIVFSTSYGLADSYFYVYDEEKAIDSGETFEGAPVYYLVETEQEIKAPAMAEGFDFRNGKVITLFESASDKYIFGKFFFANKIVELDF